MFLLIFLCIGIAGFSSCLHDVRTSAIKKEGITKENAIQGEEILNQVWRKLGGEKFEQRQVYSYNAVNTWKGNGAKFAKYWL